MDESTLDPPRSPYRYLSFPLYGQRQEEFYKGTSQVAIVLSLRAEDDDSSAHYPVRYGVIAHAEAAHSVIQEAFGLFSVIKSSLSDIEAESIAAKSGISVSSSPMEEYMIVSGKKRRKLPTVEERHLTLTKIDMDHANRSDDDRSKVHTLVDSRWNAVSSQWRTHEGVRDALRRSIGPQG